MTTIEAIKEACIALKEKAIQANSEGKTYIFETEQDVLDFFHTFWDKQTHGRHILPSFIELCYRESPDYFSYKELGITSGLYNPDAPKKPIRFFNQPDKTVAMEPDNKDLRPIQLTRNEVVLIRQALDIAAGHYKYVFEKLIEIIKSGDSTINTEQFAHAYYWNDLAKEFSDIRKNITIQQINPKTTPQP